jgi:hypothetical protein
LLLLFCIPFFCLNLLLLLLSPSAGEASTQEYIVIIVLGYMSSITNTPFWIQKTVAITLRLNFGLSFWLFWGTCGHPLLRRLINRILMKRGFWKIRKNFNLRKRTLKPKIALSTLEEMFYLFL